MSLLIRHARVLTLSQPGAGTTLLPESRARRGPALRELAVIPRGDVLVSDGRIAEVGTGLATPADAEVIEADGRVLMPAFVDCHTHACWAGDRLDEWQQILDGAPPAELAKRGGGRQATVLAVRAATRKQLAAQLRSRLDSALRSGTTTIEVKSGYGLTTEAELQMLHAIQRAADGWPGTVVPTALLAHGVEGDAAGHIRNVVREMAHQVWREFPGIAIDAQCEEGVWPLDACVKLLERARRQGLPIRLHVDRASSPGAIAAALGLHARSVDHLDGVPKEDLLALAASSTFGVMTPATSFHTGGRYARAGAFVDAGGLLALATNCNPGTAPTLSMPFVIALAVRHMGVTPAEAITATTVNAAAVLGFTDRGTIEPGQRADLLLLHHRDERLLAHDVGGNPVETVIVGGRKAAF